MVEYAGRDRQHANSDHRLSSWPAVGCAHRALSGLATRRPTRSPARGGSMSNSIPIGEHPVVLEALGMTKQYGAQVALRDVAFRVRGAAVNVLIGENGAGKST